MTQKPSLNKERAFFDALIASNLRAEGWDLLILYAQATLETGYFQNELTKNANNPFSMKATGDWTGKRYALKGNPEWDSVKEVMVYNVEDFRLYPDLIEPVRDYVKNVRGLHPTAYDNRGNAEKYYPNLMTYKKNVDGSLALTPKGKRIPIYPSYSTYPDYPEDLLRVYSNLRRQNNGELFQALNGQG